MGVVILCWEGLKFGDFHESKFGYWKKGSIVRALLATFLRARRTHLVQHYSSQQINIANAIYRITNAAPAHRVELIMHKLLRLALARETKISVNRSSDI